MSLAYERVAKKLYGRAELGIILRQLNADIEDPQPGDLMNMPPLSNLLVQKIQSASHIFRKTPEAYFWITAMTVRRLYQRDDFTSQES